MLGAARRDRPIVAIAQLVLPRVPRHEGSYLASEPAQGAAHRDDGRVVAQRLVVSRWRSVVYDCDDEEEQSKTAVSNVLDRSPLS
jgi:hypothetical protein